MSTTPDTYTAFTAWVTSTKPWWVTDLSRYEGERYRHEETWKAFESFAAGRASLAAPPAPVPQPEPAAVPDEPVFHLRSYGDVTAAELERLTQRKPTPQPVPAGVVAGWVNSANLKSAAVSRERGGPFDQHTWSEGRTDYHDTPVYAALSTPAPAGVVEAPPTWQALPYKTPLELWLAFKAGARFVLHYHGKTYPVERMECRDVVCFVQPPPMPVKVYPDGRNCESAGDGIWLEQVPALSAADAALSAPVQAVPLTPDELADKCEAWLQGPDSFMCNNPVDAYEAGFRAAESHHGITGDKHGN